MKNGRIPSITSIHYIYIGLFDGHGGTGAALKASKELHQIVHEGLEDVVEYLNPYDDEYCDTNTSNEQRQESDCGK